MNENKQSIPVNEDLPEVKVTKNSRFSLIWIIPLVSAVIGGLLVFQTITQMGVPVTITFKNGSDLVAGKTPVKFNGIEVGTIKTVTPNKNLNGVIVKVTINRSASHIARKGSEFWVVRPEIGPRGITGLDTIFSGQYIEVIPGKGEPEKKFTGLETPLDEKRNEKGLHLLLKSELRGSLHSGSAVYYREIKVGEVEKSELASDSQFVNIYIFINEKYAPLVHENSKFWNASGIGLKVGLFGAKVQTESLQSILAGGVAFVTPNNAHMGTLAKDGDIFELNDKPDEMWLKWKPSIPISDIPESIN
ncbi:MAG: MlaD family protein [Candidatus Theseobacter exili]|nr:MlaD family protein [Candidatus Theseobacter exili]